MKTVDEVLQSERAGWKEDEYGIAIQLDGEDIQVRIEPLLFGAAYLAVYRRNQSESEWDLVGEKMPITLGTPKQNGWVSR